MLHAKSPHIGLFIICSALIALSACSSDDPASDQRENNTAVENNTIPLNNGKGDVPGKNNEADMGQDHADTGEREEDWAINVSLFPDGDESLKPTKESTEAYMLEVMRNFEPYAKAHDATFLLEPAWDVTELSVGAQALEGRIWKLVPTGGVLTADGLTQDVMTSIVCHEMGHFFSGFPFRTGAMGKFQDLSRFGTFLSAEGQADYFATKDCLPRFWRAEVEKNATEAAKAHPFVVKKCREVYSDANEQNLCARMAVNSEDVLNFINSGGVVFASHTPSTYVAEITSNRHQALQIRLDTFIAGALCTVKNDFNYIPGLVKAPDGFYGKHSVASEQDAKPFACHDDDPGARPVSWFKADMPDPEVFDCSDFDPDTGLKCDGKKLIQCDPDYGIQEDECEEDCVVDDEGFPVCGEDLF